MVALIEKERVELAPLASKPPSSAPILFEEHPKATATCRKYYRRQAEACGKAKDAETAATRLIEQFSLR